MESNFNNRDFERFVRQNADQYRMFPSENVWRGIYAALHTRRRWYSIGLALLLVTVATVTTVMLLPGTKPSKQAYLPVNISEGVIAEGITIRNNTAITPDKNNQETNISLRITPPETIKQNKLFTLDEAVAYKDHINQLADNNVVTGEEVASPGYVNLARPASIAADYRQTKQRIQDFSHPPLTVPSITLFNHPLAGNNRLPVPNNPAVKISDDDGNGLPLIADRKTKNTTIPPAGRKKLNWLLNVTPTISYRNLSENIEYLSMARYNNFVNGSNQIVYPADVNTMVNHRPDLGFQLGLRTAYPISKWFSFTGGVQFNVSKYNIKAYEHPAEVATIALRDRSVSTVSKYRNTNGYQESWLYNFYFSASLPVGAELKLSDGSKNFFGIAGSLQPTYVLDNRSYLISTDYKNYAEVPSLTRRWNMNTSFEIFSAHSTGKVNWRVGPQVRYQVLSSFSKNYPIKEHLFDFGLKMGIQLK